MQRTLRTNFSSRQYMLSENFEIYYYSDLQFPNVDVHTHDYYEFYFFLDGNVSMYIDERCLPLQTGDIIIIPPDIPHRIESHDRNIPYRRFVLWLSQEYLHPILATSSDYGYIISRAVRKKHFVYHNDIFNFNLIQSRLFRILEEIHGDRFGKLSQIELELRDLLLHLNRLAYEQNAPDKLREKERLYQRLVTYIDAHPEENLTLDHLSNVFFVSKFHIAHIFKENLGISVHQYIIKKRLSICREALLGDASINETYQLYGFKDYSSFYRAFKKEYGLSPKEYKEIHTIAPCLLRFPAGS